MGSSSNRFAKYTQGNRFAKYSENNRFAKYTEEEQPPHDDKPFTERFGERVVARGQQKVGGAIQSAGESELRRKERIADVEGAYEKGGLKAGVVESARAYRSLRGPLQYGVDKAVQAVDDLFGESDPVGDTLTEVGKGIGETGAINLKEAGEYGIRRPDSIIEEPVQAAKYYGAHIAESLVADMGPSMAIGVINPTAGLATLAGSVYSEEYSRLRAEGKSAVEAQEEAAYRAAAETIPEVVPFGMALRPLGKVMAKTGNPVVDGVNRAMQSTAGSLVATGAAEATSEIVTEVANVLYDKYALGEHISFTEFVAQLKDAGIMGAGMGVGMRGGSVALQKADAWVRSKYKKGDPAPQSDATPPPASAGAEGVPNEGTINPDLGTTLDQNPAGGAFDLTKLRQVNVEAEVQLEPMNLNQPPQFVQMEDGTRFDPLNLPTGIQPQTNRFQKYADARPESVAQDATPEPQSAPAPEARDVTKLAFDELETDEEFSSWLDHTVAPLEQELATLRYETPEAQAEYQKWRDSLGPRDKKNAKPQFDFNDGKDNLLAHIAKAGGLHSDTWQAEHDVDVKGAREKGGLNWIVGPGRPLFSKHQDAMKPDVLAEYLNQFGAESFSIPDEYLVDGQLTATTVGNLLQDLLRDPDTMGAPRFMQAQEKLAEIERTRNEFEWEWEQKRERKAAFENMSNDPDFIDRFELAPAHQQEFYNEEWNAESRSVAEWMAEALALGADPAAVEAAADLPTPQEQVRALYPLIEEQRERIIDEQIEATFRQGDTGTRSEETGRGAQGEAERTEEVQPEKADLLGEDTSTAQALADAEREKDKQRNGGEGDTVAPEDGDGGLLSGGTIEEDLFPGTTLTGEATGDTTASSDAQGVTETETELSKEEQIATIKQGLIDLKKEPLIKGKTSEQSAALVEAVKALEDALFRIAGEEQAQAILAEIHGDKNGRRVKIEDDPLMAEGFGDLPLSIAKLPTPEERIAAIYPLEAQKREEIEKLKARLSKLRYTSKLRQPLLDEIKDNEAMLKAMVAYREKYAPDGLEGRLPPGVRSIAQEKVNERLQLIDEILPKQEKRLAEMKAEIAAGKKYPRLVAQAEQYAAFIDAMKEYQQQHGTKADQPSTEKEQDNEDISREETGSGRERGQESGQPETEPGQQPRSGASSEAQGREDEGLKQEEGEGETTPPSAQKAKRPSWLRQDNPALRGDTAWLENKREKTIAEGRYEDIPGKPFKNLGTVTGSIGGDGKIKLPLSLLSTIPGARGEQKNVREDSQAWMRENMRVENGDIFLREYEKVSAEEVERRKAAGEEGNLNWRITDKFETQTSAPLVVIDQDGKAWVNEGNHRIMEAARRGVPYLNVTVRWFNGAEMETEGTTSPEALQLLSEVHDTKSEFTSEPEAKPTATFEEMVAEAARWKGATMKVAEQIDAAGSLSGADRRRSLQHMKKTTKGDLDAYLMKKFGIDEADARNVSNELTAKNIPADMTANVEDFKDEPWYLEPDKADTKAEKETDKQKAKLENTGVDLRRFWEELKEQSKDSGESTWKSVNAKTQRAALFNPTPGEGATPGVQRYYNSLQATLHTFGEVLQDIWGLSDPRGQYADSMAEQVARRLDKPEDYSRSGYDYRAALFDAAREYQTMMQRFADAISGAKTVEEAERKVAALYDTTKIPRYGKLIPTDAAVLMSLPYRNGTEPRQFGPVHKNIEFKRLVINRSDDRDTTVRVWTGNRDKVLERPINTPEPLFLMIQDQNSADTAAPQRAKPLTRPRITTIERIGNETRKGNVTPQQVKDEFGLADVGFGSWVAKGKDQDHLNAAWDAFADLAEVLGVPRKAIGFGGQLHFTIGALGHGKHAAHFSPNQPHPNGGSVPVINLTNTKGDGAVAHEWGHALDYLVLRGDPEAKRVMSTIARELNAIRDIESVRLRLHRGIRNGTYMTHSGPKGGVENLTALALNYARSWNNRTQYKKNADDLGKDYWGSAEEMFARAWEAYLYDKMEGENNYLVNDWVGDGVTKKPTFRGTPYPEGVERQHFAKIFDALLASFGESADGTIAISYEAFDNALPREVREFEQDLTMLIAEIPDMIAEYEAEKEAARKAKIEADQAAEAEKWKKAAEEAARLQAEEDAKREAEAAAQAEKVEAGDIANGVPADKPLTEDELRALLKQVQAQQAEEIQEKPEVPPIRTQDNANQKPEPGTKPPRDRQIESPSAALKEAAELGVKGMENVLKGLSALFPPNKLHSFPPTFDRETYEKAKPIFDEGLKNFREAGKTLADLMAYLLKTYGTAIEEYLVQWAMTKGLSNNLSENEMPEPTVPERGTLDSFLLGKVYEINDNNALKAALTEFLGHAPSEAEIKVGQEKLELALVRTAMNIVSLNRSHDSTFSDLVELYNIQPNLNSRSSESMANQAYSTPLPLAYLASELSAINSRSRVYEPTAGNGALLLAANPMYAAVNELNTERADNLRSLSYNVTQYDASQWKPGVGFDATIMNPPFGALDKPVRVDGYIISKIDHLIAAKALEAINDNGRATIIIGADMKAGNVSQATKIFLNWLYGAYNVVDHFEVSGDLYRKQGASWPVAVITVNGRKASDRVFDADITRYSEWSAINEHVKTVLDSKAFARPPASGAVDTGSATQDGGRASQPTGGVSGDAGGRGGRASGTGRDGGGSIRDNAGSGAVSGDAGGTTRSDRDSAKQRPDAQSVDTGRKSGAGNTQSVDAGKVSGNEPARPPASPKPSIGLGSDYQVPYQPASAGANEAVLLPINLRTALETAMQNLQNAVGNVDQYVMKKLGYASTSKMFDAFMALQVDAIASSIYNIETQNRGVIIADQTGVGKGRQAAAMIRYALKNDMVPVFVTAQANLFTDMYDDLLDIGETGVKPFIFNDDGGFIVDREGGGNLFRNSTTKRKAGFKALMKGEMPKGSNTLMLTYSQMNVENAQRRALEGLVAAGKKPLFIFDESHTIAGVRETWDAKNQEKKVARAGYFFNLIKDQPVIYLSATYAKRPDNMPIFYRTDLIDAVEDIEQLEHAINEGGEALQAIVSNMLAQSGQLWRRERSFAGIEFKTVKFGFDRDGNEIPDLKATRKEHVKTIDRATEGLREIVEVDSLFHDFMKDHGPKIVKDLVGPGGELSHAGLGEKSAVQHSVFTSVVHNFISQLLLSLKADWIVDESIALHKAGKKPVIALANTMGSFLNAEIERGNTAVGKPWEGDYRSILRAALERTRRITLKDKQGNKHAAIVPLESLTPALQDRYARAEKFIDGLPLENIVLFYIDYIRHKLEAAGINTGEITGRHLMVDYSTEPPTVQNRPDRGKKNTRNTVDKFNKGEIDALILNASGSTGLSIHASENFPDQKQRHMMVAQADADINIVMQMLGRVNRTGQVIIPEYSMLGLDLPSELRPLATTANKMRSLNANTSANTESETSLDVEAVLNKYGDMVVHELLTEERRFQALSGMSVGQNASDIYDLARKFTGKMALAPVKDQVEAWDQIMTRYTSLMEYLEATNQNDLKTDVVDLQARIIESKVIYEGKAPGTIFGGDTTLHKITAKVQGRPPTAHEVMTAVTEGLDGKTAGQVAEELLATTKEQSTVLADLRAEKERMVEEWKALPQAEMDAKRDKVNAQNNEFADKISKRIDHERDVRDAVVKYKIGTAWKLDIGDDVVTGVVVGISNTHKEGQGDSYAASKIKIKFMVNGPARQITVPLSKIMKGDIVQQNLYVRDPSQLINLFNSRAGTSARETRYIATGNLLGGFGALEKGGRVVTFTAANGKTYPGILMPLKFGKKAEFEVTGEQNVLVREWKEAAAYLRGTKSDRNLSPLGVFNLPGQEVRITASRWGQYTISVLRKRSAAADAIKFDKQLAEAMGEKFTGRTQLLSVTVDDSRLDAVVKRVSELTTLYIPGSGAKSLTEITGRTRKEAKLSFDASMVDDESLRETFKDADEGGLFDESGDNEKPRFNRGLPGLSFGKGGSLSSDAGKVTFNSRQLETGMGNYTKEPIKTGTFKEVPAPDSQKRMVQAIQRLFGRRVVFFRKDPAFKFKFNGVVLPNDPKTIYINIESSNPFAGVIGHELLHSIRMNDSEMYERLGRIALRRLKSGALEEFQFEENVRASKNVGDQALDEPRAFEEMVANVLGDAFLDPKFIDELAAEGESFFKQLLNAIVTFLKSLKTKMKSRGMGTSRHFNDVEALISDFQTLIKSYRPARPVRSRQPHELEPGEVPMFNRSGSGRQLTDAQKEFMKRAGMPQDKRSLGDRVRDLMELSWAQAKQALSDSIQLGLFDKFYGIKRAYREYLDQDVEAEDSGYVAARLSTGAASVMRGILLYGAPEYRDGIIQRIPKTDGLLEIFKPVKAELDEFLGWMIARRADRLYGEGKENNFTRDMIDAGLLLAEGTIEIDGQTRNRADVYEEIADQFAEFKGTILDLAESAGLIDATTRPVWDKADWIPFYRLSHSRDGKVAFGSGMGLSHQKSGIRQLKGGTEVMSDPLGNIIMNFNHLIQASMKNMALMKTIDDLTGTEALKKSGYTMRKDLIPKSEVRRLLKEDGLDDATIEMMEEDGLFEGLAKMWALAAPTDPKIVRVMRDGKPEFYEIKDPMLLKSLMNVDIEALGGLFKPLRAAKTLLTTMVTAEPTFMARNFTRDALHAWVINEDHFIPGFDSVRGLIKSAMEEGGMLDMMFAGGSFQGGYINGTDPEAARKSIRQALRAKGYDNQYIEAHIDTVVDVTAGIWDKWRRVGDAVENANREAVYEAATKAGKSKARAVFEAKDLMDFSMHGSWKLVQQLNDMLPFFNARLQGLYKLGRSGAVPLPGLIAKEIAMRGLWIAVFSVALAWLNDDDEEYQALEEWDKDTYWHFFPGTAWHIRIPKPFEIGVIYGTIPERMYRAMLGQDTGEKFFSRMGAALMHTLAFEPIPQLGKPALEIWSNQSMFTGRPIENMGDERLMKRARFDSQTSDTMVAMAPFLELMGLSPKQGEFLVRGYLGTLGNYSLQAADMITREITGRPALPAPTVRDLPVIGSFVRGSGPAWNTRYGTELYEMHREVSQLYNTVKSYQKNGYADLARAEWEDEDNRKILPFRKGLSNWADQRAMFRKQIDMVYRDTKLNAGEKRERIDKIIQQRNQLDQRAYKFYSPMFGRK